MTLGHEFQNSERNARSSCEKTLETLMKTELRWYIGLPKAYFFSFYELRVSKSKKVTLVIDYTFSIFSTAKSSLIYESNKNGLRETDGTERVD